MTLAMAAVLGAGCGASPAVTPRPAGDTPEDRVPVASHGWEVTALDLVPARATGAAVVELSALRATPWGERVLGALRAAGLAAWEQALGLEPTGDVERIVWFTLSDAEAPWPVDVFQAPLGGVVVQLRPGRSGGEVCRAERLAELPVERVVLPAGEMSVVRCGALLWLACASCGLRPVAGSTPTARALERLAAGAPPPLFRLVASQSLYGRARCEHETVPLAPWSSMTLELGEGLRVVGRVGVARPTDLETLEACAVASIGDAVELLARVPGLTRLGVPAMVARATVARDPGDDKAISVALGLDANETAVALDAMALVLQSRLAP